MAEAIILGSGTSNGVPTLGIEYPEPFLANPKNHRTRSSIIISGPEGNLLIDCSPEMRLQLLREKIQDIDSVLITHSHADHIMGMDDLRSFSLKYRRAMKIYALPETQEDIRRVFPYAFAEFPPGVDVPRYELADVPETLNVCGLEVKTGWVWHGPTRVVVVRVNDFAYVTDVSSIPVETMPLLSGLQTLVIDAVRLKPHPNHFNLDQALKAVTELKPQRTFFTHLSHDYDHDVTNSQLPTGIELAYDGLRIPL
ncbi:MAG: MBL fold metallo-hydrolase [Armatimonadetes bacterium]|nr:MBL fold metallo-hydrolase [Armatimonadota bacterium]